MDRLGLRPHRSETFKLSSDPLFVDKVRDIVGLYLSPPNRALVLSVDEKRQIQALDREQPVLPMMPGISDRRTHSYVRHGTTSLFAAFDVASGFVIGKCYKGHRATEFLDLLKQIDANVPPDLDVQSSLIVMPPTRPRWSGHGWRAGLTTVSTSRPHRHPGSMLQMPPMQRYSSPAATQGDAERLLVGWLLPDRPGRHHGRWLLHPRTLPPHHTILSRIQPVQ